MKYHSIAASLLGLALLNCARDPTLLVTVENVPSTAQSLQVVATHSGLAAIMDLDPFNLPQPTAATSTFLLKLPASFSGDVSVSVGAFKGADGLGCLAAAGSNSAMMLMSADDTMRVPLMAATDTSCSGTKVTLSSATPSLGNVNGGETIVLNGWGFKPGAKVMFGTTAARMVTYVSAAQLQVVTPAKAGFGPTLVTVTNPDNTSDNKSKIARNDIFRFFASTADFTGLPFQPSGDFSNANGFVFGVFDTSTTLDAALASQTKDYVRILLTTGTLTNPVDYTMPAGSRPTGVAAADFNKDGHLDVVVNSQGDSMVRILLNDGKGNLTLAGSAPVGSQPEAIATADLNGDGNADVVVANRAVDTITILMGDGKGGFLPNPVTVPSITDPIGLAIGDMNSDGQPDLAIADYSSGSVTLLFNDMGNFQGRFGKATLPIGTTVSNVLVTDTNNDGLLDIVAADTGTNQIVVIVNMKLPNISKYTIATEMGPRTVQAGDINGDGFVDLAVPCNATNSVDVFLNNGGMGFSKVPYQSFPAQCLGPAQLGLYDIDRDGRIDAGVLCQTGIGLLINHTGI